MCPKDFTNTHSNIRHKSKSNISQLHNSSSIEASELAFEVSVKIVLSEKSETDIAEAIKLLKLYFAYFHILEKFEATGQHEKKALCHVIILTPEVSCSYVGEASAAPLRNQHFVGLYFVSITLSALSAVFTE
jgi:hypothetical protein